MTISEFLISYGGWAFALVFALRLIVEMSMRKDAEEDADYQRARFEAIEAAMQARDWSSAQLRDAFNRECI